MALGMRQRDGYVTRVSDGKDLGDEDMAPDRSPLRWKPSEAFSLTLRGDYTKEDENGSPFVFHSMNEAATFVGAASIAAGCPNILDPSRHRCWSARWRIRAAETTRRRSANSRNGGTYAASSTLENLGASLVADWQINDTWSLKSITSDRRLEWTGTRDADNTPLLILHTNYDSESDQFSQELQAIVEADRLDGVFGLYYFDEESFDRLLVPLGNPGTSYDTQRVAMDTEAQRGVHRVDVQVHGCLQRHGGHPLHGGNQGTAGHHVQCGAGHQRPSQPHRPRSVRSRDRRPRRPDACSSRPIASSASSRRPRNPPAFSIASMKVP